MKFVRGKNWLWLAAIGAAFAPGAAMAAVPGESAFVFNTTLFLISGMVVMFMAAGFAMLEAGMVRSRNAATICLKNIALYSIAGLMFYAVGYNLMYMDVGQYFGSFMPWAADDTAALAEGAAFEGGEYAASSDWFFQMVFCATAASIVSGTLAERIKLWPFLIFVAVLTGILYPITGSWEWGGGWLDQRGFSDFAGSTLVHSVGGWAALAGAVILGARTGKYVDGKAQVIPGSSMPLATVGVFILWLGWFGFNGGSQLALGSAADAVAVANIFANTNVAAAAGVVAAMIMSQMFYQKVDITFALNGAIGGLVAITAEPLAPALWQAIIIGGVGGVLVVLATPMLEKMRIDDVVGAIPAHLVCGIWGTMIVPWTNGDADYLVQLTGVAAIGAFTLIASSVVWIVLRFTLGLRATPDEEMRGLDHTELGIQAYPEFAPRPAE